MSEELLQTAPFSIGRFNYYKLGASTLGQLKDKKVIAAEIADDINKKKPDGLVTLGAGTVKAYIEYKQPGKLKSKRDIAAAIAQEIEPAKRLCNLLIVSDGQKSFWVNPHTGNEAIGPPALPVFDAKAIAAGTATEEDLNELEQAISLADNSLSADNDTLFVAPVLDPTPLAKSVWQKIWINTGKEPEKCLYNVVELFVFKFLSDLGVMRSNNNFATICQTAREHGNTAALEMYAQSSRIDIRKHFPAGADGTSIINGTIFVNEKGLPNPSQARLFVEVMNAFQAYERENGPFRNIDREFKTRLYESFLRQGAGLSRLGQYFTPRNVVRGMVSMAAMDSLPVGTTICDPFCGVGGFLLEAISEVPQLLAQFEPTNGSIHIDYPLVGYDKGSDEKDDERTIILAKANSIIYLSDLISRFQTSDYLKELSQEGINPMFTLLRSNLGTFEKDDTAKYDVILTNPPYVTSGSRSLKDAIQEAGLGDRYTSSGRGTEALAIQWIIRALKPGGRAYVVVPDGLLNQTPMLQHIKKVCEVLGIVSLPDRTFYSTPKKTYILALRKKTKSDQAQSNPVFGYVVSEIGETRNANRWPIDQNDLVPMADAFRQFAAAPTAYRPSDLRASTVDFSEFDQWPHWMIDRHRDHDDLVSLGAADIVPAMDMKEFNKFLKSIGEPIVTQDDLSVNFIEVSLGDKGLFTTRLGKRIKKEDCIDDGIPCISANVRDVFGYIESSDLLEDFSKPSITWGIDGELDWHLIPADEPFHPTDHCGVLRVKNSAIDVNYLYYHLRYTKGANGFDRVYRANLGNIKRVSVLIPVTPDGQFDLKTQGEMAELYRNVAEAQEKAVVLLDRIAKARIDLGVPVEI